MRSIAPHDVPGPLALRVHPRTRSVFVAGDPRDAEIIGLEGEEVMAQPRGDVGAGLPRGLDAVVVLQASGTPTLDLAELRGPTRLRDLTVRDVPGRIAGTSVLGALTGPERTASTTPMTSTWLRFPGLRCSRTSSRVCASSRCGPMTVSSATTTPGLQSSRPSVLYSPAQTVVCPSGWTWTVGDISR
ncbi:hypothetical protein ACFWMU_36510 [Streptomyces sp. NPDC058357]|uniref:hypothetical protein n=1 Tax=unclassified Streptomyces TaxID=2593676 RepID=UPI00365D4C03